MGTRRMTSNSFIHIVAIIAIAVHRRHHRPDDGMIMSTMTHGNGDDDEGVIDWMMEWRWRWPDDGMAMVTMKSLAAGRGTTIMMYHLHHRRDLVL